MGVGRARHDGPRFVLEFALELGVNGIAEQRPVLRGTGLPYGGGQGDGSYLADAKRGGGVVEPVDGMGGGEGTLHAFVREVLHADGHTDFASDARGIGASVGTRGVALEARVLDCGDEAAGEARDVYAAAAEVRETPVSSYPCSRTAWEVHSHCA